MRSKIIAKKTEAELNKLANAHYGQCILSSLLLLLLPLGRPRRRWVEKNKWILER
jgi:hypothetical protein